MEQFLILVVLAGGAHAFFPVADTTCNVTETSLCSVTLGGSVYIQVMNRASGFQLRCKRELPSGAMNVFNLKKEKVTIQEAFRNRTEFFINNGTLKISNVERNDSSQYTVEVFDSNGVRMKDINFKLEVKENTSHILIPVCVGVGALVILVTCCCVYRGVKRRKKSGSAI